MKRFWNTTNLIICGIFVVLLMGWIWTPYPPNAQDFRSLAFTPPSSEHWLGVDGIGRDSLSRLWNAASHSIGLGLLSCLFVFVLSIGLLVLEQSRIPFLSKLIRTVIGLWVAMPVIFIGLLLLVFLSPAPSTLILAVGLGLVPFVFRQLKSLWEDRVDADYVQASRLLGASRKQVFWYTLMPNLKSDLLALFRLLFALAVLELSGLAFLGLIGDPDFAELGSVLKQNHAYLYQSPELLILPGILLSGILFAAHLVRFRAR